jgi:hypothetical protein
VLTPRGETFHGFFKDDVLWGPGVYCFVPPPPHAGGAKPSEETEEGQQRRWRVKFEGMFNGRPAGKGAVRWSDGEHNFGEFDGERLVAPLEEAACAGAVLVARQNAAAAVRAVAEVKTELGRRRLWEGQLAELAKACVGACSEAEPR